MPSHKSTAIIPAASPLLALSPVATELVHAARTVMLARQQRLAHAQMCAVIKSGARQMRRALGNNGHETTTRFVAIVQALQHADDETKRELVGLLRDVLSHEEQRDAHIVRRYPGAA